MVWNIVFSMKKPDNASLLGTCNSTKYVCTEYSLYHTITFKVFQLVMKWESYTKIDKVSD